MVNQQYLDTRKKYQRPQAMVFCKNAPTLIDGSYVPSGDELRSDYEGNPEFLILSDDNRSTISLSKIRIENRKRMINGSMRSYHVADKVQISTSWEMLASRSYNISPEYTVGGLVSSGAVNNTTDGGAGGMELLKWYENNQGSFWVILSYDKYDASGTDVYDNMDKSNEAIEVFFADFSYDVIKRGAATHDFWNISLSLEEV